MVCFNFSKNLKTFENKEANEVHPKASWMKVLRMKISLSENVLRPRYRVTLWWLSINVRKTFSAQYFSVKDANGSTPIMNDGKLNAKLGIQEIKAWRFE